MADSDGSDHQTNELNLSMDNISARPAPTKQRLPYRSLPVFMCTNSGKRLDGSNIDQSSTLTGGSHYPTIRPISPSLFIRSDSQSAALRSAPHSPSPRSDSPSSVIRSDSYTTTLRPGSHSPTFRFDSHSPTRRPGPHSPILRPEFHPAAFKLGPHSPTLRLDPHSPRLDPHSPTLRLDPHSPILRPGSAARDSGYNTDVSPATTVSPATNRPRQHQYFNFDNLDPYHVHLREDKVSPLSHGHFSQHLTTTPFESSSPFKLKPARGEGSTPPFRLSPVVKVPMSSRRDISGSNDDPRQSTQKTSLTGEAHCETEGEFDQGRVDYCQNKNSKVSKQRLDPLDLCEDAENLQVPDSKEDIFDEGDDDNDDEDDDVFQEDDSVKTWVPAAEARVLSHGRDGKPQSECCSTDTDQYNLRGACGQADASVSARFLIAGLSLDQRIRSLSDSSRGRYADLPYGARSVASLSGVESNRGSHFGDLDGHEEDSLTCSQGFQPGFFDGDSRDSDSDSVFTFEPDESSIDEAHAAASRNNSKPSRAVPIARERLQSSPGPLSRRRRFGVASHLQMPSGGFLSWSSAIGGVTVSTQTPHLTSFMIHQIMGTSAALPNEARGTAAARLRRLSEGGVPLPFGVSPLPDIIPVGRDRSLSVPDLHSLARARAREFGQELRRLSDEFNYRRNLSPVYEEFNGHPASYPLRGPSYFMTTITHFGAMIRETFYGRQSTPVDQHSHNQAPRLSHHEDPADE